MANPARRTHTGGTIVSTLFLCACGILLGVWLASFYDVLRVGLLDTALANELGYIGEITGSTVDPRTHGIPRLALPALFLVGLIGGGIAYASTAVSRRSLGDPEAIAYALGWGFIGAAAGFAWFAADWPVVDRGEANAFGEVVRLGGVWVPILLAGIGALCMAVWWTDPDDGDGGAPPAGT